MEEDTESNPSHTETVVSEAERAYVLRAIKEINRPLQELQSIVQENPDTVKYKGKEHSSIAFRLNTEGLVTDMVATTPTEFEIVLSAAAGEFGAHDYPSAITISSDSLSDDIYEQYLEKLAAMGRLQKAGGLDQEWPSTLLKNLDKQRAVIHDQAATKIQNTLQYSGIELSPAISKKIFDTLFQIWMYQKDDKIYLGEVNLLVDDEELEKLVRDQFGVKIAIDGDIASGTHDWPRPEYRTVIHLHGERINQRKGQIINFLDRYIEHIPYSDEYDNEDQQ